MPLDNRVVDIPARIIQVTATQLVREYHIANTYLNSTQRKNPYEGKITGVSFGDPSLHKSKLGQPVMVDLTLLGGHYTDSFGTIFRFGTIQFDTVLVSLGQQKEIVKTVITGRAGTVKEYIAEGDYELQINGIVTSRNGVYPYDDVKALKQLLDAPVAIGIVSKYLQNLDVHNIVVTNYNVEQEPGAYSQQAFSISAISDIPVELQITDV